MPDRGLKLRGCVRAVLGDNVDTDVIYPGRYLNVTDREKTAEHLFELVYPEIRAALQSGGFIVAGQNFGCGSSREQAVAALKFGGAGAVIAASFARIFFRNALNLGLAAVVSPEATVGCSVGDELEIDLVTGQIHNMTQGRISSFAPLDPRAAELLSAGGLIPYLKHKYAGQRREPCLVIE